MKINWGNTWIGFLLVLCIIGVGLLITVFVGDKTPKKNIILKVICIGN